MPERALDTDPRDVLQMWWETGRRDGAAAKQVFGNRALTSWAGLALLPGLGVVALSGLVFGRFWQLHYIVGLALIPLLLLKLGSTGYRALSYYVRRAAYRAAGAPEWIGRLLAPALVLSTLVAMGTGIWMWSQHSEAQPWAKLHVLSVVAMGGCVALHLLLRTPTSIHAVGRDGVAALRHMWPRVRVILVGGAVAGGVILGIGGGAQSPFPTRAVATEHAQSASYGAIRSRPQRGNGSTRSHLTIGPRRQASNLVDWLGYRSPAGDLDASLRRRLASSRAHSPRGATHGDTQPSPSWPRLWG